MNNKKSVIATSSVTYASKGVQILSSHGIRCRIVKLRSNQTKNGCAYGISVFTFDREEAVRALLNGGVRYTEIIDD